MSRFVYGGDKQVCDKQSKTAEERVNSLREREKSENREKEEKAFVEGRYVRSRPWYVLS